VLTFVDPDGLCLALVGVEGAEGEVGWSNGDVPAERAIRGFHGTTLMLAEAGPTGAILTDVFGFAEVARERTVVRYRARDAAFGNFVHIRDAGNFLPGRIGRGSVHHIAFRATDDAAQAAMAEKVEKNHDQAIGIDLPLKALVTEDASGKVWLSYNDPHWIAQRQ